MPLINTSVPNLIQGVSQQPDATRFDGQCEEQENALSSVAEGLKKRTNTRHIARLMQTAIDSNSFVHFIDRSEQEKYVIIQQTDASNPTQNVLKAFNAKTGASCTINGNTSHSLASSDYLSSSDPSSSTQALTIADTTFLNNSLKTPQLNTSKSPKSQKEAIVVVQQGDYDTNYVIKLSSSPILSGGAAPAGTPATFNSPILEAITPATVPATYKLKSNQFGPSPINSPLASGGVGYNQNNKEIFVSSNGVISQLPQIESTVNNNGAISQLSLINSGVFESVLGSSTVLNLAVTMTTSESGSFAGQYYTGQVNYTLRIQGQSLQDYNNIGRPVIDLNLDSLTWTSTTANARGGILEYQGGTWPLNLRSNGIFSNVRFSTTGYITGTKYYNNVSSQGGWLPYEAASSLPSNWASQAHTENITLNNYIAPTVTLTAGTPVGGTTGTVEGSIKTNGSDAVDACKFINTDYIGSLLKNDLTAKNTSALFSIVQDQNLLILRPSSPTTQDFYVSTSDGLANDALQLLYKEVASISDLPVYCKNGFKIKIQGDSGLDEDDYYAEFATNDNSTYGSGVWNESIGFDVKTQMDADTMPHGLVNVGLNEFVFGAFNGQTLSAPQYGNYTLARWGERTAGDDESNPFNSFIGTKPITAMTLFKNRLGFSSGSNVVFSEAGQFFNFSRTTVRSLLDSAPIDVSVSSPQVADITSCVPFQGSLILFSDRMQLKLAGGDILSPKTVSITPVTQFAYQSKAEPVVLGSYIYYPFNRGGFSGLNEFNVNATTDTFDASEITEHVPAYIPSNINIMASSASEDFLVVSNKGSSDMYIYVYFWNSNQKVLSSWSKFSFTGKIEGISFSNSTLYAVITHNGETNLVEMPLESGLTDAAGYITHLDNRVAATVTNGSSTITLPYTPDNNSVEVYTTDGLKLNCTNSGATVTLAQAVSGNTDVWVGIPYTMKYTFSEQLFKAKAGNGKSPSNAAKMRIRNGSIYYADSAYFKVKVTPKYRDTYENVFTPDVVGSSTIGSLSLDSGFYRFPVFTKPQDTTITIENESALPSTFQSAEFESFVHSRSNRYG